MLKIMLYDTPLSNMAQTSGLLNSGLTLDEREGTELFGQI
jgi:hypothetical protein